MTQTGSLRVVVAGGGVAALETAVALRRLAGEFVDVEILAPSREFVYRPLAVAEPFARGEVQRFDLERLAAGCGARHRLGSLRSVDAEKREIRTNRDVPIRYDALVLALGAAPRVAVPGALTFRGPEDVHAYETLLAEAESGRVSALAFAVPGGVTWALPLYELALMTAARLEETSTALTLVTPEEAPLSVFGSEASARVAELLAEKGVEVLLRTYPDAFERSVLTVVPGAPVRADRAVALPRLAGEFVSGLPQDGDGFVRVDEHGRVVGLDGVYAAGDITSFGVKQGGLAAQQADAVAEAIAAEAGAEIDPTPFRPVLRGLVLTDGGPTYLRAEIGGGRGGTSEAAEEPLWWPAGKIAARYLGPYLAEHAGLGYSASNPAPRA